MAVKVGNSWVTEEAYAYAKSKVNESVGKEEKKAGFMLNQLSDKYPDLQFTTSTKPFSGNGKNNIGIAPNILRDMENDSDKRLEYEALIYDCNQVIKNLPDKTPNGSTIKSFGFIIHSDGSLSGYSVSESGGDTNRTRSVLDKNKKDTWLDKILEKKKQKKIEEKKLEEKRQVKIEEQKEAQEKLIESAGSLGDSAMAMGKLLDIKV